MGMRQRGGARKETALPARASALGARSQPSPVLRGWGSLARLALCVLLTACLAPGGASARPASERPSTAGPTVTLVAVGDLMLDRGVGEKIERFGGDYPFRQVAPILKGADITLGNLECPLSQSGIRVEKPFSFRAKPVAARGLARAGFDVLSLANNHTLDCGRPGLMETLACLGRVGLRGCGAGRSRAEAESPVVLQRRGLKIAFLAFCDFLPEGTFLRDDVPTIAFASPEAVRAAVARARRQADLVVVSFHWGVERSCYRTERQETLALAAIRAGASLVLGHHPHVLQPFERPAPRTLIAYSLGNFVFDRQRWPATETAILRCQLSRKGVVGMEVLPARIRDCRPYLLRSSETQGMLRRLRAPGEER